jgi:hypothetical protein
MKLLVPNINVTPAKLQTKRSVFFFLLLAILSAIAANFILDIVLIRFFYLAPAKLKLLLVFIGVLFAAFVGLTYML